MLLHQPVGGDHLARDPAEQPAPEPDQDREPVDQAGDQARADHQQGHRQGQADDEEFVVALGGARHRHDVVEAHHRIGHHDGPDRPPQAGMLPDLAIALVLAPHQLDRDVQQDEPAHHLQQRHREQVGDDEREDDAQQSRRQRAHEDADAPLPLGQAATGQRDHDRVVARQDDVDPDDLQQRQQERRGQVLIQERLPFWGSRIGAWPGSNPAGAAPVNSWARIPDMIPNSRRPSPAAAPGWIVTVVSCPRDSLLSAMRRNSEIAPVTTSAHPPCSWPAEEISVSYPERASRDLHLSRIAADISKKFSVTSRSSRK
ncbi:hypothetical protein AEGHOMDF_1059 [Methylobacterium soli]|nr:hypothetical protein AEGHOMDF_1059 [Methylobacterium soli]